MTAVRTSTRALIAIFAVLALALIAFLAGGLAVGSNQAATAGWHVKPQAATAGWHVKGTVMAATAGWHIASTSSATAGWH